MYTKTWSDLKIFDHVQLRDPKNNFIFNFNFDDKMKIFEQFEFGTK